MKICAYDFKGIAVLEDFDLKDISVLTGVNSGGKSSLIQLLLLIKQSLETRSQEHPLRLNRPYALLGRFESVVRKAAGVNGFSFQLRLGMDELHPRLRQIISGGYKRHDAVVEPIEDAEGVSVVVGFKKAASGVVVHDFSVRILHERGALLEITRNSHGKSYQVETNSPGFFFSGAMFPIDERGACAFSAAVSFNSFFPDYFEGGDFYSRPGMPLDLVRHSIEKIFSGISYLGPLREEPKEYYFHDDEFVSSIGNKGENAAYLFAKYSSRLSKYKKLGVSNDGEVSFSESWMSLEGALNYWLCEIFGLAKRIKVARAKTNRNIYEISLRNHSGSNVPINHVGFGISQIFPVLVEVLRPSDAKRIIILEQPEIHLHPKVQSCLFDFVASAPDKVSFLIETHSDHFINRLRRRVAEDATNEILRKVNLSFVTQDEIGAVGYRSLDVSEIGAIDVWPEGFFDQYERDIRALVRAQAKKRMSSNDRG